MSDINEILAPLINIARAYYANELDDEARRFDGFGFEENERGPNSIILYQGRGGKTLLTLDDCLRALHFVNTNGPPKLEAARARVQRFAKTDVKPASGPQRTGYKVCEGITPGDLADKVKESMKAGWVESGGLCHDSNRNIYLQALVR